MGARIYERNFAHANLHSTKNGMYVPLLQSILPCIMTKKKKKKKSRLYYNLLSHKYYANNPSTTPFPGPFLGRLARILGFRAIAVPVLDVGCLVIVYAHLALVRRHARFLGGFDLLFVVFMLCNGRLALIKCLLT